MEALEGFIPWDEMGAQLAADDGINGPAVMPLEGEARRPPRRARAPHRRPKTLCDLQPAGRLVHPQLHRVTILVSRFLQAWKQSRQPARPGDGGAGFDPILADLRPGRPVRRAWRGQRIASSSGEFGDQLGRLTLHAPWQLRVRRALPGRRRPSFKPVQGVHDEQREPNTSTILLPRRRRPWRRLHSPLLALCRDAQTCRQLGDLAGHGRIHRGPAEQAAWWLVRPAKGSQWIENEQELVEWKKTEVAAAIDIARR